MRVLLIEDDTLLGQSLKDYLELKGVEVKWLTDGGDVEVVLLSESFDVIILDLILPHQRGEEILRKLRADGIDVPVLVLTAKRSLADKEVCFDYGADDFLSKPFHRKELLLRLRALARRGRRRFVQLGDLRVDLDGEVVYRGDREVKLSKKAWLLLSLLLRHRGEVVSKERILSYVWGGSPVGEEIVRVYIKELRKILPPGAIETYKGRGYRLR
ncbi:MAG: DNA-binding response regulator [Deltaproteobacteria bacterium]|nr:MAG: DNA-binding response regulator [Deltaproteobacteria bacterium]